MSNDVVVDATGTPDSDVESTRSGTPLVLPVEASARSVEGTSEWVSYVARPSGAGLGALIAAVTLQNRGALVEAVENHFFESSDWRVAQHAAMLHLDRFQPFCNQVDIVKALCFAEHAF